MPKKYIAAVATIAAFLTMNAGGTSLLVGRSGNHIYVATNAIDTEGHSHCKLHFSRSAVVMRATQAASMRFTWPDGRTETVDFESALDNRIHDLNEPVDRLQEILVQDAEERMRDVLQHYKADDPDRINVAHYLASEYVIVGREHSGFLGTRAFTLEVLDPRSITFDVRDLTRKLRDGEVIDYTQGEIDAINTHGQKAVRAAIDERLAIHNEVAQRLGNKAFSPPYLMMDVTHASRSFVSDPGPCDIGVTGLRPGSPKTASDGR